MLSTTPVVVSGSPVVVPGSPVVPMLPVVVSPVVPDSVVGSPVLGSIVEPADSVMPPSVCPVVTLLVWPVVGLVVGSVAEPVPSVELSPVETVEVETEVFRSSPQAVRSKPVPRLKRREREARVILDP